MVRPPIPSAANHRVCYAQPSPNSSSSSSSPLPRSQLKLNLTAASTSLAATHSTAGVLVVVRPLAILPATARGPTLLSAVVGEPAPRLLRVQHQAKGILPDLAVSPAPALVAAIVVVRTKATSASAAFPLLLEPIVLNGGGLGLRSSSVGAGEILGGCVGVFQRAADAEFGGMLLAVAKLSGIGSSFWKGVLVPVHDPKGTALALESSAFGVDGIGECLGGNEAEEDNEELHCGVKMF